MEQSETLFRHTKQNQKGQRKTFAGIYHQGKLQIGVSQCSASDQFNKTIGRSISLGRANNTPISVVNVKYPERVREAFHIACDLLENLKK